MERKTERTECKKYLLGGEVWTRYFLEKAKLTPTQLVSKLEAFGELCEPLSTDAQILDIAYGLEFDDFEDAMQYATAKKGDADVILTRDKTGFVKSKISVYSPTEYLDTLMGTSA